MVERWISRLTGRRNVIRTPTVLQLEAAECGAASLAMVLASFGRYVPLETLRSTCGVSRDGSKASNILKAARRYGLEAKGFKAEPEHLRHLEFPAIAFVNFCHFLVVEGFDARNVYLNDPSSGRRRVTHGDFEEMFTGVILTFKKTEAFKPSDERPDLTAALMDRTAGLRSGMALILLASIALVIPGLIVPILSRVFVDHILVRGLDGWIMPLLIGMLLTALVRYLLLEMQRWYLAQAETRMAVKDARELFAHILRLPISYFGTRYSGEVAGRLHLSEGLAALLTGDVTRTILNIVTAVFFLILMIAYSPTITLIVVILSVFNVLVVLSVMRLVSEAYRKLSIDRGKLGGVTLAGLRDIETFKASGSESAFFARWSGLNANVISATQEIGRKLIVIGALPSLITAWIAAAVLIVGGLEIMRGEMSIGTLVAFQSLSASFIGPLIALTQLTAKFQEVRSFTERTEDVLRHPMDPVFNSEGTIASQLPAGRIALRDVSFGYLPLEPPLISGLTLGARAGESIALVGSSGSGKSTVGRLLVGLYQPKSGEVLVDAVALSRWPRAALASRLAYIDQDVVLFEGTIRENLSLWDKTIPEAQIVKAAKDALIHDVIASRPGAYDSKVDEGGRNFSGGQRQRLEIARALATEPNLLVLDEATSALDTVTEAKVMENIRERGATLVIIAHRLSTIRDCDEIIVLDRGQPIERGTHDELLALDGRYADLIEA